MLKMIREKQENMTFNGVWDLKIFLKNSAEFTLVFMELI